MLDRPALTVRISKDEPEADVGNLVFEVENTSGTPTSLTPVIPSTFYYPTKGQYQKGKAIYDVREPTISTSLLTASLIELRK